MVGQVSLSLFRIWNFVRGAQVVPRFACSGLPFSFSGIKVTYICTLDDGIG